MTELEEIKNRLKEKKASLVVAYEDGTIKDYYQSRIMDLVSILKQDENALKNSKIADKVVGKVASSIMVEAGVKEIYAETLSEMAIPVLENANRAYSFGKLVPYIKNNDQTGMCPMETKFQEEKEARKIYREIICK